MKSSDLPRAWNVVYSLAVEGLEEKKRKEFDSDIFRRPPGETRTVGDAYDIALVKGAAAYAKSLERAHPAIDSEVKAEGV